MQIEDFLYKKIYPPLNLKSNSYKKDFKISETDLKKNFYEYGLLSLEFEENEVEQIIKNFYKCTDILGLDPATDANRRKKYTFNNLNNETLASVDIGSSSINPHSEASFSPIRPAIIAFLCMDISSLASMRGLTTLIDGYGVWNDLENTTKKLLQSLQIKYYLEIDLNIKKYKNGNIVPTYLDYLNISDVFVNTKTAKLEFKYINSFAREHPISRKISLANHAFVPLNQELQIRKREFILNNKTFHFSKDLLDDIFNKMHRNTFIYKWKKGKAIIIDNYRFMHGRLSYDYSEKREILIRQLKKFKI